MELLSSTTEDLSLKNFSIIDLKNKNIYIGGETKDIYSETSDNTVNTVELSKTSITPVNIRQTVPDYSSITSSDLPNEKNLNDLLNSETSTGTSISLQSDKPEEFKLSETSEEIIKLQNLSETLALKSDTESLLKTLAKTLSQI